MSIKSEKKGRKIISWQEEDEERMGEKNGRIVGTGDGQRALEGDREREKVVDGAGRVMILLHCVLPSSPPETRRFTRNTTKTFSYHHNHLFLI